MVLSYQPLYREKILPVWDPNDIFEEFIERLQCGMNLVKQLSFLWGVTVFILWWKLNIRVCHVFAKKIAIIESKAQIGQFFPEIISEWGLMLLHILLHIFILYCWTILDIPFSVVHRFELFVEALFFLLEPLIFSSLVCTLMLMHTVSFLYHVKRFLPAFRIRSRLVLRQKLTVKEQMWKLRVTGFCLCVLLCPCMSVLMFWVKLWRIIFIPRCGNICKSLWRINSYEVKH